LRRNQTDPAFIVLDHFNQMTNSNWKSGRPKRRWVIRGRLSEDYSPEDLMLVVDYLTENGLRSEDERLPAPENAVCLRTALSISIRRKSGMLLAVLPGLTGNGLTMIRRLNRVMRR
jgi:uncharacterized phage protein (TIGR02220 family)